MKPSQALPRQLSRRESQAIKFITKVLSIMRKLLAVLLALPLGELAKPLGFDWGSFFHKKGFRKVRRLS